ncbi:MAG: deaminase [bacterium]
MTVQQPIEVQFRADLEALLARYGAEISAEVDRGDAEVHMEVGIAPVYDSAGTRLREGTVVALGVSVGTYRSPDPDARPSFEAVYMALAREIARRSTCRRLQVGTVITSTDFRKVLAVGYNGNASGLPNTCDRDESGVCGCLHSEENAVINCDAPRYEKKIVFVTHMPCPMCAKRLINLGGVQRVWYGEAYRDQDGLKLLATAGIPYARFSPGVDHI